MSTANSSPQPQPIPDGQTPVVPLVGHRPAGPIRPPLAAPKLADATATAGTNGNVAPQHSSKVIVPQGFVATPSTPPAIVTVSYNLSGGDVDDLGFVVVEDPTLLAALDAWVIREYPDLIDDRRSFRDVRHAVPSPIITPDRPRIVSAPAAALDHLDAVLRKHFHEPDTQAIRIAMATIKSHYLNIGDPAWLYIVAPPGAGKTTSTVMGAAGLPQVQILGSWTPHTFISGFGGKTAPGLLEKLGPVIQTNDTYCTTGNAILICKDYTTVLAMQRDRRAEILSQLREIHDGQFRIDFGTGVSKVWRGRITFLAAVTPVLDHYSESSTLGERFLQVRWNRPDRKAGEYAIDQQTTESNVNQELTQAVNEVFARALCGVPEISNAVRRQVAAIAELVAHARTHVYRSNVGTRDIEEVPIPEANTRISKGLAAIGRGLAALRGLESIADAALRDVFRVALDCIPPTRKELLLAAIYQRPTTVTGSSTGRRAMEELQLLGLLKPGTATPELSPLGEELAQEARLKEVLRHP